MSGRWPVEKLARTRVLVVEEQPDSHFSLSRLLHHFGCDYDVCQVGSKAIIRATAFMPDLILLDMEMLGDDGYAVAAALRRQRVTQPMIVAITCDGMRHRPQCETSGIDLHVFRPVQLETLRVLLEESGWQSAP